MEKWGYLIVGGVAGTLARFILSGAVAQKMGMQFPYGTLAVNMVGCFLVGFLDLFIERKLQVPASMRLLCVTGFCGAFTTFSAFILETYTLARAGDMFRAFIYVFASIAFGLVFFRLGLLVGERL